MQETNEPIEERDDNELHHAGDKGFKTVMKDKTSALELMETLVPEISIHLDLTDFELDNTNYVNKDFQEYYSDVVYRTYLKDTSKKASKKAKKKVAIALLFEHKKTIVSYFLLFLQLLEYIIFIWREDLSNKRKPSIIIPIVVFQGKKGLRIKQLHDCFKGIPKELLKYIPNFHYHLTNVHDLSKDTLLGLNEKNYLRSLFLAYTFTEKKKDIQDMLFEVFKFFKHRLDSMAFFQMMFEFLAQEDDLNPDETKELFSQYLSSQQKEGVMTTYQIWVNKGKVEGKLEGKLEGKQEGEARKARLSVLRGKWNNWSAESLADQAELPISEVNNLLNGYDNVYKLWSKNKGKAPDVLPKIAHLTEQEVGYLFDFFSQKHQAQSDN
jgi:hypothetical protein